MKTFIDFLAQFTLLFAYLQVFLSLFLFCRHRSKHNSSGSSSIAVLHTDSESNLDGFVFDVDSRGSSVSLNSVGSQQDSNQHSISTVDGITEYTNG